MGLHQRLGSQLRAGDSGREAEVVLDTCARAGLPAYGNPFQHQRAQALGGAVDGSRQSGGSTTDDNNVVDLPWYRAVREPELIRQYARGRIAEDRGRGDHYREVVNVEPKRLEDPVPIVGFDVEPAMHHV